MKVISLLRALSCVCALGKIERGRDKEGGREMERDRETERQRDRETEGRRDRGTEGQRGSQVLT